MASVGNVILDESSRITTSGSPVARLFVAVTTAGVLVLAALAMVEIWVPFGWWRVPTMGGAILSHHGPLPDIRHRVTGFRVSGQIVAPLPQESLPRR
jgi:hypothetical protein